MDKFQQWREKEMRRLGITGEQIDAIIEIDRKATVLRMPGAYWAITELIRKDDDAGLLDRFGLNLALGAAVEE